MTTEPSQIHRVTVEIPEKIYRLVVSQAALAGHDVGQELLEVYTTWLRDAAGDMYEDWIKDALKDEGEEKA